MNDTTNNTIHVGPCPTCGTGVQLIDAPDEPNGLLCRRVEPVRYCLIRDDDAHWYIIPADKRDEAIDYFEAVADYWSGEEVIFPDGHDCPPEPHWLRELGSGYTDLTFAYPRRGGEPL